jgi:hypothetical protein
MGTFSYQQSPYPVREDLAAAYRQYWQELARPGSWWDGTQRVAIANEVRLATRCEFCSQRRAALSPYNFPGEHQHGNTLEPLAIDAIHRIVTDQGRITRAWVEANTSGGLSEEQYVELLGIVVTVFSIDEFNRALGQPLEPLPDPQPGEPDQYRPAQTEHETGFVAMIPPQGATGSEADLWSLKRTANVLRALSLVPNALRAWQGVAAPQYLSPVNMLDFGRVPGRSIDRMQIELIAGRVSSYNECFY